MRAWFLVALAACASTQGVAPLDSATAPSSDAAVADDTALGAHYGADGSARFRVASSRATRIEVWVYATATDAAPIATLAMHQEPPTTGVWTATLPAAPAPLYYGFRVWGPNWPYDPAWTPGSETGRITDADAAGNRMNPNKLVFDPYARELSHDPTTPDQPDASFYSTSAANRTKDSGPVAPRAVLYRDDPAAARPPHPTRAFADDVVYEVHLRGFTNADPAAGACAGTYAGAATRAAYLASLGVTAVEFLPLAETPNDRNDVDPTSDAGDNYWGYSTLAYFAPDRRYACDRSPGGPTRELRAMVDAFHAANVEVLVDVVYNHTAEGGGGSLYSLRGLDNAGYYQLDTAGTGYTNSNGVGADLAPAGKPEAAALVVDSLRYWRDTLGVDGFRFDLAPVLGNTAAPGDPFHFDPAFLAAIVAALPPATPLVAEPWGTVAGSYAIGHFPTGWSEWNDHFRDQLRTDQNQRGVANLTPSALVTRLTGSPDLFDRDARTPAASVNYLASHDGLTLRDLYACNGANNAQAWPLGPSDGGTTDNRAWDHGGDAAAQRQAARTGLALLTLSQGVPMITGGDERLRSLHCNNNSYNLDSPATWLDWSTPPDTTAAFTTFARRLFQFRAAHAALRHAASWLGPEVTWFDAAGNVASTAELADAGRPVLAWRLDGVALGDSAPAIFAAYNRDAAAQGATLPPVPTGATAWYRVADTGAWMEAQDNSAEPGAEYRMMQTHYDLAARSLALFVAR